MGNGQGGEGLGLAVDKGRGETANCTWTAAHGERTVCMGYYLFDNPTVGLILGGVAEVILLVGWVFTRSRRSLLSLFVGPAVVGLFLLADAAVQTNREELESATRLLVQAAADEDAELIISQLSEEFCLGHRMGKQEFSKELRQRLGKPVILSNRIRRLDVKRAEDGGGEVEFAALTRTDPKHAHAAALPIILSSWRFEFVREDDGEYRVSGLEMLSLNNQRGIDIFSQSW